MGILDSKKRRYAETGVKKAEWFEYDELKGVSRKLLYSQDHKDRTIGIMILLGIYTGLRLGDLLTLDSDNFKTIEGEEALIVEAQQKTGKPFSIVLNESIIFAIQDYGAKMKYRSSKNALFINPATRMTYSVAWVTKRFRELREKEPVLMGRKFSTHSLRKTHAHAVYKYYRNDIIRAREVLQHQSVLVTQRYLELTPRQTEQTRREVALQLFT